MRKPEGRFGRRFLNSYRILGFQKHGSIIFDSLLKTKPTPKKDRLKTIRKFSTQSPYSLWLFNITIRTHFFLFVMHSLYAFCNFRGIGVLYFFSTGLDCRHYMLYLLTGKKQNYIWESYYYSKNNKNLYIVTNLSHLYKTVWEK